VSTSRSASASGSPKGKGKASGGKPAASKGGAKGSAKDDKPAERVVAENRKARHEYEIVDTLECGIALVGSEVKSLRVGRMSLDEAYGRIEKDEARVRA